VCPNVISPTLAENGCDIDHFGFTVDQIEACAFDPADPGRLGTASRFGLRRNG